MIEQDLQDAGVDIGDEQLMGSRSWRWLRVRIEALLTRPPLGFFEEQIDAKRIRRHPIWPNRLQRHFYGPAWGDKTA